MEEGKDVGLFKWAWLFHNAVNQRLKKPIVSWSEAKRMYSPDEGVCTSDCGQPLEPVVIPPPKTNVIKATLRPIPPSNYSMMKKSMFKPS
jgi:hypothetical protein